MAEATKNAAILVEMPLKGGGGHRAVASAQDGTIRVFKIVDTSEAHRPELSFTMASAERLAELILAGDEHAMTLPGAERMLAAALLVGMQ